MDEFNENSFGAVAVLNSEPKYTLPNISITYRILELKILNSGSPLPKGHIWTFDSLGVDQSLRNAKDGITYFGCKPKE